MEILETFQQVFSFGKSCIKETGGNKASNTYHGQAKGGRGKFSSEFFTKILKNLAAYFTLHQPNRAVLGIVGKVSSCSTI